MKQSVYIYTKLVNQIPIKLILLALLCLSLAGCHRKDSYLPLSPGNVWVYEADVSGQVLEALRTVGEKRDENNQLFFSVVTQFGQSPLRRVEIWSSNERQIWQALETTTPGTLLFLLTLTIPFNSEHLGTKGEQIQFPDGSLGSKTVKYEFVDYNKIELPVGMVKAVHVRKTFTLEGEQGSISDVTDYWFGKSLGIVREEGNLGGVHYILRLKSYSLR